jgi:hypothetical protein
MRFFRKKEHHAAVYDTRPIPGDKNQFEPYFIAMCECDWIGDVRQSSEEAFRDAYAHTEKVDEELKRPLA